MIQLHCTQKLFAKLPLDAGGRLRFKHMQALAANDEPESTLSDWHANLIVLQRRNCVLFVHDSTRFPVLIKGLLKADFAELDWHFCDAFMNTLLKCGANDLQMQSAHQAIMPLACDTQCDRSVQGTLNRMKGDIEHLLWYDNIVIDDLSVYRTGAWLADRPTNMKGTKGCIFPVKAMLALLDQLAQGTQNE